MRRMLAGLGNDAVAVVTKQQFKVAEDAPYKVLPFHRTPAIWRRVLKKLRIAKECPWKHERERQLQQAVDSPVVSAVLVHFLTHAVKFESVWKNTEKPIFVHCHGYDVTWDKFRHGDSSLRTHPVDYVERVLDLPPNVSFIANSNETRRRIESIGVSSDRIVVKYLGVEIPDLPPVRDASDCDEQTVLYLGRLVDCKGPDLTIHAFDLACQRGFKGRLVVAGAGEMQLPCELARARSNFRDRIELLGVVDTETGQRLRDDATIFTAHNCRGPLTGQTEAFGVSIVEAMAAGLPVVSGRSGSLPEIVEDGKEGILFDPGDIDAHANALIQLGKNQQQRREMGFNGWQRAKREFSIEREMENLRRILGVSQRKVK